MGLPTVDETLPRIEDFRSDLTLAQIHEGYARQTRALAMQSYLHAFPAFLHMRQLTEFIQGRQFMAVDEPPLGGWFLMRALSNAQTDNTSPNVDTLYGATFLLLDRQGPVVLSVPPIPERYYSVALLDAYFNNFAIVSPRTCGNDGGHYLIVPPGWAGEAPEGIRSVLVAPTPAINLYQRIFTRDESEYPELHHMQDSIQLAPLAAWRSANAAFSPVDLSDFAVQGMRDTSDPLQFFTYTNFYRELNPPPAAEASLMALFKTAGVGPGSALPDAPHQRTAIGAGAADAQAALNARISYGPFRNGWRVPDPNTGKGGPDILSRAAVQMTQIGSFPPEEAIYFFGYRDADGQTLHGDHQYTLTFTAGNLPPLDRYGFWSLTMYNEASFLVDNPLNRYIVRPDSPGLTYAQDGSLTIYIQAEAPDGAPEANWLPASEGNFSVALRTYLPQPAILNGAWFPPALARVD
ncbi:MAG: DUF1254 domain-containing protein [Caldilineaceae bacterium]